MKKINVNIPGSQYPVYSGKNIFDNLHSLITKHKLYKNVFLIVDHKVFEYHRKKIFEFYNRIEKKKYCLVLKVSEKEKSHKTLFEIYNALIDNGFGRDTLIVSIGGGITGDIAGFAASTFTRGVQYVNIPTTLLSMVDSSVGGKTGVNLGETKNIIGSFYQPKFVLVDTEFLKTLPKDEVICGIGEIVKSGFLISDNFFVVIKNSLKKLKSLNGKEIANAIETCVKFKANIVENDEKEEKGLRKILNLGHTFAHAIEVEQKHKIKHGHAVIAGLACALHLSNKLNMLGDDLLEKYLSLIIMFVPDIKIKEYNPKRLYEIMKRDKKNKEDKIKFVLMSKAGNIFVDVEAEADDVYYALSNGLQYFIG